MENLITYGLRSLYYALGTDGGYSVPKAYPGAVKISLSPEQFNLSFTGLDCIPKDEQTIVYGYKGTLTVAALLPDFCRDIYGDTLSADGGLIEKITTSIAACAILFETDGTPASRHCYYSCRFGRPDFNAETDTKTKNISTVALPVIIRPNANKDLKHILYENNSSAYQNWFEAVK